MLSHDIFDVEDDTDAQWWAWGCFDGFTDSARVDDRPESDADESPEVHELRARSYDAGVAAGRAQRECMGALMDAVQRRIAAALDVSDACSNYKYRCEECHTHQMAYALRGGPK